MNRTRNISYHGGAPSSLELDLGIFMDSLLHQWITYTFVMERSTQKCIHLCKNIIRQKNRLGREIRGELMGYR